MTTAGQLFAVVYASTAVAPFDDLALGALLAESRASNADAGITGMLLYRAGRFFQVLEGDKQAVRSLLTRIERDDRHTHVRTLVESPIEQRDFAEWTMGYEPITTPTNAAPEGFRDTFDDLESADDPGATLRAARELSLWFRVRAGRW